MGNYNSVKWQSKENDLFVIDWEQKIVRLDFYQWKKTFFYVQFSR